MATETVLVLSCKASDWNASTGQCAYPFYSVASNFPPPMDVGESLLICAAIGGMWGLGFMIKQAAKAARSG